ncbi:hypothetical protein H7X69_00815 [Candidatus Saccharibacteria bacterium]|nr:hypothetical protein [Candidatus Saccharibacteria bacterium]
MGNVGRSEDLRKRILQAAYSGDTLFLVIDQARTVTVRSTELLDQDLSKELSVMCEDVNDGTTIVLYLPYASDSVARATIIRYSKEEE